MAQSAISSLQKVKKPEELMGRLFKGIPEESRISPESLKDLGEEHLGSDPIEIAMIEQAKERKRQKDNDKDPSINLSRQIIEKSEMVTKGGCIKIPSQCQNKLIKEQCVDTPYYESKIRHRKLEVRTITSEPKNRVFTPIVNTSVYSIPLNRCNSEEKECKEEHLISVSSACYSLSVKTPSKVKLLKLPSCDNPTVTVKLLAQKIEPIELEVQQTYTSDVWEVSEGADESNLCLFTHKTKCLSNETTRVIDGKTLSRPCWEEQREYKCLSSISGNCEPLLQKGCQQVKSECSSSSEGACQSYKQTYQCSSMSCTEEKELCLKPVECANGNCKKEAEKDASNEEVISSLANLGALAGSAIDAENNASGETIKNIFRSENYTCKRAWGEHVVNCCSDKGHSSCSDRERELAMKKSKGLAYRVGSQNSVDTYCSKKRRVGPFKKKCVEHSESWCVFNSRLAYLIRAIGAKKQLKIGFGMVGGDTNGANCRGITPEELSKIDLEKINLSDLEKDILKDYKEPNFPSGNTLRHRLVRGHLG